MCVFFSLILMVNPYSKMYLRNLPKIKIEMSNLEAV